MSTPGSKTGLSWEPYNPDEDGPEPMEAAPAAQATPARPRNRAALREPEAPSVLGSLGDAARNFGVGIREGLNAGFGDELMGLGAQAASAVHGIEGGNYDTARDSARSEIDAMASEAPGAMGAGKLAGSVARSVAFPNTLAAQMAQGATQGVGESRGEGGELVFDALAGAAIPAALRGAGAAGQAVYRGGKAAAGAVADKAGQWVMSPAADEAVQEGLRRAVLEQAPQALGAAVGGAPGLLVGKAAGKVLQRVVPKGEALSKAGSTMLAKVRERVLAREAAKRGLGGLDDTAAAPVATPPQGPPPMPPQPPPRPGLGEDIFAGAIDDTVPRSAPLRPQDFSRLDDGYLFGDVGSIPPASVRAAPLRASEFGGTIDDFSAPAVMPQAAPPQINATATVAPPGRAAKLFEERPTLPFVSKADKLRQEHPYVFNTKEGIDYAQYEAYGLPRPAAVPKSIDDSVEEWIGATPPLAQVRDVAANIVDDPAVMAKLDRVSQLAVEDPAKATAYHVVQVQKDPLYRQTIRILQDGKTQTLIPPAKPPAVTPPPKNLNRITKRPGEL